MYPVRFRISQMFHIFYMSKHVKCQVDIVAIDIVPPGDCFIEFELVVPSCSSPSKMYLEDVVHMFAQPLIDLTLSLGYRSRRAQGPHTSVYLSESTAMSSYAPPCSPVMTITSSTNVPPITVMAGLQNCLETWDQSRDSHHLGFIGLDSVIGFVGIFNFIHMWAPFCFCF